MAITVPTVDVHPWVLSVEFTLTSTLTFISLVLAVGLWTHHHGPVPGAAWTIRQNSRVYSFVSGLMLLLILHFTLEDHSLLGRNAAHIPVPRNKYSPQEHEGGAAIRMPLAPLAYHLSKLYEYTDILLVLATHGPNYRLFSQQPIDLHFAFHHLTTPYLTLFRMVRNSKPGWEVFAGLNCVHHVLMYAFFGGGVGWAGLSPEVLRSVLPWTGALQLVAGIAMEGWSLRNIQGQSNTENHERELQGHWIALGLLCSYLVLYTRDMMMRAQEAGSSAQKQSTETKSG